MATVTCPNCGLSYDDTYRWTYCPHEEFHMLTAASRQIEGRFVLLYCTSVDQVDRFNAVETVAEAVAMGAFLPGEEASEALLEVLRRAGDEWGPLGVALVAARLADPRAVVRELSAQLVGEEHRRRRDLQALVAPVPPEGWPKPQIVVE